MKKILLSIFTVLSLSMWAQYCVEPGGDGAYYTGVYRNMFKEVLGKTDAEVDTKVEAAFQHIFYGGSNDKLYYETGQDMAYILDVANNDVRSEGMSYGMMICVQLDKQAEFDKLWRYTKQYMQHSSGNLDGYFRWQLNTDGSVIDNNPAPDGEAYFITALFFAANRWGNGTGIFDYEAEAQSTLQRVQSKTGAGGINSLFNTNSKLITFGPNGGSYDFTDPSYNLPAFFELWGRWSTTNTSFWQETPEAARKLIRDASHSSSGLTTDYSEFNGQPKPVSFNQDAGRFMYDAWRTIMNLGMDYHWFKSDPNQPVIAERYLTFFQNQGSGYVNHYDWDGSNANGDHSTGLVACNAVASLAVDNTTLTQPFLDEFWNVGVPSGTYRYYDGMLYMLALLNCSGDFKVWKPECENPCETPAPTVAAAEVNYELGDVAVQLSATGTDLKWYEDEIGGDALTQAPTPSTATTGTMTYYVAQTLDGCEGPRASITVNVTYTYEIFKTSQAPTIDGNSETQWESPNIIALSAEKVLVETISSDADLSGNIMFLWDDANVYFYAEITDDTQQNDSENSYEDDAIEIYFDINNDKATSYSDNDVQYSFGWDDGTVVGSLPDGRSVANIDYAVVETATGYSVEGSIPWATLQGTPAEGQLLGLDFMINDDDDGTGRDAKLSWNAATDDAWQNPSLFGIAMLNAEDIITGMNADDLQEITVSPNPANEMVYVKGLNDEFDYQILDLTGGVVLEGISKGEIELNDLSTGLYFLVLPANSANGRMKIVVQ